MYFDHKRKPNTQITLYVTHRIILFFNHNRIYAIDTIINVGAFAHFYLSRWNFTRCALGKTTVGLHIIFNKLVCIIFFFNLSKLFNRIYLFLYYIEFFYKKCSLFMSLDQSFHIFVLLVLFTKFSLDTFTLSCTHFG